MTIMTNDAMIKFRAHYREDISPAYHGGVHMLSMLSVGLLTITIALSQLSDVMVLEYSVFPLTLLLVNFAEYYAHRYLGHKKTPYGKLFYSRHTGDHHSFFLEHAMAYESSRDWRVVLFPLYLIFAFIIGLILPGAYLLNQLFGLNVACLYSAAAISGYLFYEIMHFSYHIPKGHWAEKLFLLIPGWAGLRHLHSLHHQRESMREINFNITLPVFDFLLGTLHWQPIESLKAEK